MIPIGCRFLAYQDSPCLPLPFPPSSICFSNKQKPGILPSLIPLMSTPTTTSSKDLYPFSYTNSQILCPDVPIFSFPSMILRLVSNILITPSLHSPFWSNSLFVSSLSSWDYLLPEKSFSLGHLWLCIICNWEQVPYVPSIPFETPHKRYHDIWCLMFPCFASKLQ